MLCLGKEKQLEEEVAGAGTWPCLLRHVPICCRASLADYRIGV